MSNDPQRKLSESFEPLREGLLADGADLRLVAFEDGVANAELLVSDETCLDCILPRQQLEETLLLVGKDAVPELQKVVLHDHRETK